MEKKFYEEYKWTEWKFWQNFWEYYRIHMLVIVVIAFMAFIGIKSCMNRVEQDLSVIYIGEKVMLSPAKLEVFFDGKVADMDGDGQVLINIENNPVDMDENADTVTVMLTRIDAEIMGGDPFILMTDGDFVDRFVKMSGLQSLEEIISDLNIPEEYIKRDPVSGEATAVNITNLPIGKIAGVYSGEEIYVGVKIMPFSKANKEKYVQRHNQAMEIVRSMLAYDGHQIPSIVVE
ncbi:MAG: hypothetical protein IKW02_00625 [Clostridia bacterium]|nr:hypothetical protein [Clostridia bacterium]